MPLPARLRASIEEPGAGAVVFRGITERGVWPQRQVLYQVAPPPVATEPAPLDRALSEAESVELRAKDHPRAIVLYERALATAARDRRPPILHRLARTLRKAGRDEEALALYRRLAASSDRIGALPADLIAKYEICSLLASHGAREPLASAAFDLYQGLVDGRWVLEKTRYLFCAATAREWLTANGAPTADVARCLTRVPVTTDRNPSARRVADARTCPVRSFNIDHRPTIRVAETNPGLKGFQRSR